MADSPAIQRRSIIYADLADRLAATCDAMIADDGRQLIDAVDGVITDGNVIYCMGEMRRIRGVPPQSLLGRDYCAIARCLASRWGDIDTLKASFIAMGLAMLGVDGPEHPVLGSLDEAMRASIEQKLRITRAFPHNWEVFNASLRIARSKLYGDDPELCLPHLEKLVRKYEESGYFDDSANLGDYNNYGLMTINFALRASEMLPMGHVVRSQVESMFRPHAMRYVELLKLFIGRRGEGWFFGRSSGVLGQMQCMSYLEQLLALGWLSNDDAAWARCACRKLTSYMVDVFWDDERSWFSFRDEHRRCYSYRTTISMTWDLWRYFLQLENYARIDEANSLHELSELPSEPLCREVITHAQRRTAYLVWSDGDIKWQMPIMGGPTVMTGDNLPRPYLPGLFEWTTDVQPRPVLCPRFIKGGEKAWPAWWPSSTELHAEGATGHYRVVYDNLCGQHGETLDWPISVVVEYHFAPGYFERVDQLTVREVITLDEVCIEALQGAPHPKSRNYPKVYAVNFAMQSNMPGVTVCEDDVSADPEYRNYYSHAVKRHSLSGQGVTLLPGEYYIKTAMRWR